jgi:hypothetical protein
MNRNFELRTEVVVLAVAVVLVVILLIHFAGNC